MEQQVIITTDLGYGDAGKGTMVDALVHAQDRNLIVRYSGGAQAAHNVVTPDGHHHTFSQFGSGMFKTGTRTYLGPQVLVQPQFLFREALALEQIGVIQPLARIVIDERAPIITPYHQLANQMKELARGSDRHGSTGIGIGETRADAERADMPTLRAGDLRNRRATRTILEEIRDRKQTDLRTLVREHAHNEALIYTWQRFRDRSIFDDAFTSYYRLQQDVQIRDSFVLQHYLKTGRKVIFEAAQGTLLDEDYGFFPYVTRGKVRDVHAHELLAEVGYQERPFVLGITRAYAARHGPGPFPTESAWLRSQITEAHNEHGRWQGAFRMGHFDLVATRYAITVNAQVDGLAITSLDQLAHLDSFHFASAYRDALGTQHEHLPLPEGGNLSHLAVRSNWLMQEVSAIYGQIPMTREHILGLLSTELQRPVLAISTGMTRASKQFFPAASQQAA